MIKPSPDELLAALAAGLEETVLPGIAAGPSAEQLRAGIRMLRKLSLLWDRVGPYLFEDNRDIANTLREIVSLLRADDSPSPSLRAIREDIAAAVEAGDGGDYPSPKALAERNLRLQELLVGVRAALDDPSVAGDQARGEALRVLWALHRRMIVREGDLTPSVRQAFAASRPSR